MHESKGMSQMSGLLWRVFSLALCLLTLHFNGLDLVGGGRKNIQVQVV